MKRTIVILLIVPSLLIALHAARAQQQNKSWTDWSKKDVEKMLNNSAWAQTQNDTDTSEMFYSPTGVAGSSRANAERSGVGAVNSAVSVQFHVRFFSARPIRQALARQIELQQKPGPDIVAKLRGFGELKAADSIIVTLTFDCPDGRYSGVVMQAFNSAVTATLKNDSYLELNDGKKLFLEEYVPPGKDGFGARFIFLRQVNGQPFISKASNEVRFFVEYPNGIKVSRRFKIADMMYEGDLEY